LASIAGKRYEIAGLTSKFRSPEKALRSRQPGFQVTGDYHHFSQCRQAFARHKTGITVGCGKPISCRNVLVDKFLIIYNCLSPESATIHRAKQQR
jgi:hypothetical protein